MPAVCFKVLGSSIHAGVLGGFRAYPGMHVKGVACIWSKCRPKQCLVSDGEHCAAGKKKALVFAGVPASLTEQLSAAAWCKEALERLGGKGGGKPNTAQGQGPKVEEVPAALEAAEAYAVAQLKGWS